MLHCVFGKAFEQASTIHTAENGFEKSGICPFNRHLFKDTYSAAAISEKNDVFLAMLKMVSNNSK